MSDVRIKALQGFRIEGGVVNAGSVLDVPQGLADELFNSNKAELAPGAELHTVSDEEAIAEKLRRRKLS